MSLATFIVMLAIHLISLTHWLKHKERDRIHRHWLMLPIFDRCPPMTQLGDTLSLEDCKLFAVSGFSVPRSLSRGFRIERNLIFRRYVVVARTARC